MNIAGDPVLQLALKLGAFAVGPDHVAHHALQVVAEPRHGKDVGQARRHVVRGGGLIVLILLRAVQCLRANERRTVGVLAVDQADQARFRKLAFTTVADGEFRRAFHIGRTVAHVEIVNRQATDFAARLHATDLHRPAIFLVRAVDVDRHRMRRVHPGIMLAFMPVGLFFKVELIHWLAVLAVGRA